MTSRESEGSAFSFTARFEPGDEKRVTLVALGGAKTVFGLNALPEGGTKEAAMAKLAACERL